MMDRKEVNTSLNVLLFIAILVNLLFFIYISQILVFEYPERDPYWFHNTLYVGTTVGPQDLDPTDCWDTNSRYVIEQIVETLFTYDTRQFVINQTMPRINWLATAYSWDVTNTILTVDIRTGIEFHDGTIMNATAVAWNFNRFMYLMNHTGELPADRQPVKVHSLYEFPNGDPVFKSIVASDADTVVFTLTAPYAPILDAMCYISCGILSPETTPATKIIDLNSGEIVGTGPFKFEYYIPGTELRLIDFWEYWGGVPIEGYYSHSNFDSIVYNSIDDPSALNYAMIAGDIDILFEANTNLLPNFRTNPWITVYDLPKPGLVYQYLGFNTNQVNLTWRKAMSYAINYTYIIEEMLEGRAHRAYSAISPGYSDAFNHWLRDADRTLDPTNGSAQYNLTTARQIILTDLTGDSRLDPRLKANNSVDDPLWSRADLIKFNFTYYPEDLFRSELYIVLEDWFDDIGIKLGDDQDIWGYSIGRPWWYLINELQIFFYRWGPDYLDPFNMLCPLFSNISVSNWCQINDKWIMGNLSLALQTTNDTTRTRIYHDIQWRLFADLYCHAPLFHDKIIYVHAADLYDVGYNSMGKLWALPIKRNFTWVPSF
ncbi:MAG: ABC transporter substrate-binding protein [Candidatus Thorarchaeota archaeon]